MAITPNSISFNYKQGEVLPPSRIINFDSVSPSYGSYIDIDQSQNWFTVDIPPTFDSGDVSLNSNASSLNPGNYSGSFSLTYYEDVSGDGSKIRKQFLGSVSVFLYVQETIVLSVVPEQLSFNYQIGGINPQDIIVNVTSENNWTITENSNWLSISTTSGSNNGSFQVSVTPSGLPIGTHTTTITVDDGVTVINIPVTLIISEPDTGTDYLYVTPVVLNFGYTVSGVVPPLKRVELNSSDNWTVTTNKTWISLSASSGVSGAGSLDIGLQNLAGLTVGNHFATVTIVNGSIVKTINITLSFYEFVEELLDTEKLYFSEDNNLIKVSSGRTDTFLQIKVSSVFENTSYNIPYNIPFIKGVSQKRIGLEAKRILGARPFIGLNTSFLNSPFKPAFLNFEINEVDLFNSDIAQSVNLQNILFTKGVSPINGWMSDAPNTIYTTKNGIILFSFLGNENVPVNELIVEGDVTKTYTFSNSIESFYTAMIAVSDLKAKEGDEFTVTAKDVSINVVIKPEDKEQSFVFWENQWGFWDVLEFTGEFTAKASFKETSFEFRKDYKTIETKVLDIKDQGSFQISTGWVYTDEEVLTLRKMLNATNLLLYKNNELVRVKNTTKNLELSKTNNFLKSYDLTFENIEV